MTPDPDPMTILAAVLITVAVIFGLVVGPAAVVLVAWIGGFSTAAMILVQRPTRRRLTPLRRKAVIALLIGGFLASNAAGILAVTEVLSLFVAVVVAVAWSISTAALAAMWAADDRGSTR